MFLVNGYTFLEAFFSLSDVIDVQTESTVLKPVCGIIFITGNSLRNKFGYQIKTGL